MKNEQLRSYISAKGISIPQLAKMSGIPVSTTRRIVDGVTHNVKASHMEAISKALKVPVHTLFDVPLDDAKYSTLLPDEAGVEVIKTLSPEESMLLYLYQNSGKAGKTAILTKAKTEYYRMQATVLNRPLKAAEETDDEPEYSQMSLSSFIEADIL